MFRFVRTSKLVPSVLRSVSHVRPAFVNRLTLAPVSSCTSFSTSPLSRSTVEGFGTVDPPKQMTSKEVEERVIKAIKAWDRFPQDRADKLSLEARFVEDLGLDSLDLVEITMALEDEFGFEIPEADVDKLKTPRAIHQYICAHEDVLE